MPTNRGSVFSETLQEITNTKFEELSKKQSDFEDAKASIISRVVNEPDPLKRLALLSRGVKDCYGMKTTEAGEIISGSSKNPDLELELKNLDSFMAQSKHDPSITPQLMGVWEESLLEHLNMQSSKLEYASLYAQLVTEWLSTEKLASGTGVDVEMTEGFEDVGESMKQEARRDWEKVVFESAGVDESALKTYLDELFGLRDEEKPAKAKALMQLRNELAAFEITLAAPKQFNPATLTWVINGLLASDLLTDERREVVRDFLGNQIILTEVADVLNMRLAALTTWSWGESVALEQQRKITGIYNVVMHEDVLQAIFLHYIGVKWSVFLKGVFRQFRNFDGAWISSKKVVTLMERKRREYFLGPEYVRRYNSVHKARDKIYRNHYFMASLMGHEQQKQSSLEGEVEANYAVASAPRCQKMSMAQQPARAVHRMALGAQVKKRKAVSHQGALMAQRAAPAASNNRRQLKSSESESEECIESDDDTDSDGGKESRNPMEDKQRLIRLLSTEIAINTKLHGEVTAFHSVFESWNSLLPHETILAVMSLIGVSKTWTTFFAKFLKAPLKFLDDSPQTAPRTRCRGTPASHVLSEIFGESILFCLDFAVNQETYGHNIFRMHDDFWFWSRDHDVAKTAWKAVSNFANATRTYIDLRKSGTVRISRDPAVKLQIDESLPVGDIRWGFLKLSTTTGRFEIDQAVVDKHIIDLRRQLADKRKSIISFIQTWNTFAATFFTTNFGQPANCFGRAHVDQILATHERIQREVFSSSSSSSPPPLLVGEAQPETPITSVVEYIKHLLCTRFGVSNIPDAYLFFPIELGGLDLRSPFISTLPVREAVVSDPATVLNEFVEAERQDYAARKLVFDRGDNKIPYPEAGGFIDPDARGTFMAFGYYARYREDLNYGFPGDLASVFRKLLEVPAQTGGVRTASAAVRSSLDALARSSHGFKGITGRWNAMDPYWRWVAQLYGPEAIKRFGGLDIIEPGLLPTGMVSIFRDRRLKWE